MSDKPTIDLSLVSHTNQGKTTLVRTLLRSDVGEVLDRAHVTDENAAYPLIETDSARLVLWDTPGFGDSARLRDRLEGRSDALGWFVGQVWDRLADRPLWCGQQAVINVRDEADVVVYLVNASEIPEAAGYLQPEMEIVAWIGRPVVVVLNQTGPLRDIAAARAEVERWRRWAADHEVVREVLSLDAFTRSWVQEDLLFRAVERALPEAQRTTMNGLRRAWEERNREVFDGAMTSVAAHVAATASNVILLERNERAERRLAAETLRNNVRTSTRDLAAHLIELHGLEGRSRAEVEARLEDLATRGRAVDERKWAVGGGLLGGLSSGLLADILSGGLTFGGGAVAGMVVGALGGLGLARSQHLLASRERPAVAWTEVFLTRLAEESLLLYLAIAHHGRGRGEYRDTDEPEPWKNAVHTALERRAPELERAWSSLQEGTEPPQPVTDTLRAATEDALASLYPQAFEDRAPRGA